MFLIEKRIFKDYWYTNQLPITFGTALISKVRNPTTTHVHIYNNEYFNTYQNRTKSDTKILLYILFFLKFRTLFAVIIYNSICLLMFNIAVIFDNSFGTHSFEFKSKFVKIYIQ